MTEELKTLKMENADLKLTVSAARINLNMLRQELTALIEAYEAYVKDQYPAGSFKYPAVKRQHDVDMAPAVRARLVLRGESNEQEIKA